MSGLTILTLSALFLYILSFKKELFLWPALAVHVALNGLIWYKLGYPPFIGGYGSMVFFSFLLAAKTIFTKSHKLNKFLKILCIIFLIGSIFMPIKIVRVEAVLTSYWLGIHVPLFFLGYLSLSSAFVATFLKDFEQFEKKETAFALFFIFAGILTGAFWAEVSWGRFWGWDAKEVWALSTWLFVLSYFHFEERKMKKIALYAAFFSMIMTYVVVSFIVPGLHSYIK